MFHRPIAYAGLCIVLIESVISCRSNSRSSSPTLLLPAIDSTTAEDVRSIIIKVENADSESNESEVAGTSDFDNLLWLLRKPRKPSTAAGSGFGEPGFILLLKGEHSKKISEIVVLSRTRRIITQDGLYLTLDDELLAYLHAGKGHAEGADKGTLLKGRNGVGSRLH